MSLWVKRTVQLLGVALLFASCEDDSFLLGFKNQNKKFKGIYQEITLGTSEVIALDSAITDGSGRLLIGEYYDNVLGYVRTESFTEIRPLVTSRISLSGSRTAHFDSITFQLRLDFYHYGLATTSQEKFTIHRLNGDTLTYWKIQPDTATLTKRYYTHSTASYDPTPLGEVSFEVNYDTLQKNLASTSGRDTLLASVRLDDAFGQELFNVALNDSATLANLKLFRSAFKGLAFIPSQSTTVLGFNPSSSALSRIRVHYHTEENGVNVDTLFRDFNMLGVAFNSITPSRIGDFATITTPYQGMDLPSGLRAIQSGDRLVTKVDLAPFYNFMDTLSSSVIVNSAELVIESVNTTDATKPIEALEFRFMKDDYRYYSYFNSADSSFMGNYVNLSSFESVYNEAVFVDITGLFLANSDYLPSVRSQSIAASLLYSTSNNRYTGNVTRFIQSLLNRPGIPMEDRLANLSLYPAGTTTGYGQPAVGKNVNRTVFGKNGVKLRIYYTRPTSSN